MLTPELHLPPKNQKRRGLASQNSVVTPGARIPLVEQQKE